MARYLIDATFPADLPVLIGAHTGERIGSVPLFGLVEADFTGRRLNPCDDACRVEVEPVLARMGLTLRDLCSRPRGPQREQKPVSVEPLASHGLSAEIVEQGSRRLLLQAQIPETLIVAALPEIVGARLAKPRDTVLAAFEADRWVIGSTQKVAAGIRQLEKATTRAAIVELHPLVVDDPQEQAHNIEALHRLASVTTDAVLTRDGEEWPVVAGAQTTVLVADASGLQRLPARYVLAPFAAILPSNNPQNFAPSPGYPPELQERDYRTDLNERQKVIANGQNWEPSLVLNSNPDAVNGPPITDAEGRVLGGNSRAMSMMRYASSNPESYAAALRTALRNHCAAFGLEGVRADLDQMMLVRVVEGVTDPRTISRALNRSLTLELGKGASSVTMGKLIPVSVLEELAQDVSDMTLREILRDRSDSIIRALRSTGFVTTQNSPIYISKTNELTTRAVEDIEAALVGLVVRSTDLYNLLHPKFLQLITRVAPALLAIESFEAYAPDIADARAALSDANFYMRLSEMELLRETQTVSMFGETERVSLTDPNVARWCLWWLQANRGPVIAAKCLSQLVRLAQSTAAGPDMFGGGVRDAEAMLDVMAMQSFADNTVIGSWRDYIEARIPFRPLDPQPSLFGRRGNPAQVPPAAVRANAALALQVRSQKPPSERGGTAVGLARGRDLAHGRPVSVETAQRMARYFARHEVDKTGSTWDRQGKGWQAWHLWGGDEGRAWADDRVRRGNPAAERSGQVWVVPYQQEYDHKDRDSFRVFAAFQTSIPDVADLPQPNIVVGFATNHWSRLRPPSRSRYNSGPTAEDKLHDLLADVALFFDGLVLDNEDEASHDTGRNRYGTNYAQVGGVLLPDTPAARIAAKTIIEAQGRMSRDGQNFYTRLSALRRYTVQDGKYHLLVIPTGEPTRYMAFVRHEKQIQDTIGSEWPDVLKGEGRELGLFDDDPEVAVYSGVSWNAVKKFTAGDYQSPESKYAPRFFPATPYDKPFVSEVFKLQKGYLDEKQLAFLTVARTSQERKHGMIYLTQVSRLYLTTAAEQPNYTPSPQDSASAEAAPRVESAPKTLITSGVYTQDGRGYMLMCAPQDERQRAQSAFWRSMRAAMANCATFFNDLYGEAYKDGLQFAVWSWDLSDDDAWDVRAFRDTRMMAVVWLAMLTNYTPQQINTGKVSVSAAVDTLELGQAAYSILRLSPDLSGDAQQDPDNRDVLLIVDLWTDRDSPVVSVEAVGPTFVQRFDEKLDMLKPGEMEPLGIHDQRAIGIYKITPRVNRIIQTVAWKSARLAPKKVQHLASMRLPANAITFNTNNGPRRIKIYAAGSAYSPELQVKEWVTPDPTREQSTASPEKPGVSILEMRRQREAAPEPVQAQVTEKTARKPAKPKKAAQKTKAEPQKALPARTLEDTRAHRNLDRMMRETAQQARAVRPKTARDDASAAYPQDEPQTHPRGDFGANERETASADYPLGRPAPRARTASAGEREQARRHARGPAQHTADASGSAAPKARAVLDVLQGVGGWAMDHEDGEIALIGPILLALADELRLARKATRRGVAETDQLFAHMYWSAHNPTDPAAFDRGLLAAAQAAILTAQGKPSDAVLVLQPERRQNPLPGWAETLLQLARLVTALSAASSAGVSLNQAVLPSDTLLPDEQ